MSLLPSLCRVASTKWSLLDAGILSEHLEDGIYMYMMTARAGRTVASAHDRKGGGI